MDEALLNGGVIFSDFVDQEETIILPTIMFTESNLSFIEDFFFGQNNDDIYYIAIPVFNDVYHERIGTLRLGYDEQPTLDLIHLAYYRGILFAIGYMLFSLLLVIFFGKRLSTPISNLRDMARLIAAGDHSVDIHTNTEISEVKHLAHDLEHMRLSMLKQHQEVIDRELRLQAIMDNVIEGIIVFDERGVIHTFNCAAETIFSINSEAVVGKSSNTLMSSFDGKILREFLEAGNKKKLNIWHEMQGTRKDGSQFLMEFAISEICLNDGRFFTALIRDVTERYEAEAALRKLSRAVESSSSAVIITDTSNSIEYINPQFTDTTGYTKEEVLGKTPRVLQPSDSSDSIYEEMLTSLKSKGEWRGEMHNQKKDGTIYRNRASISGVMDAQGNLSHFISINDDVTREYELTEQLNHQANHDALTGLINRREFERCTEQLLSTIEQDKTEHALCFMDLDQFKVVNDTCGHAAGDELLRQISRILQSATRTSDALARLGGDEFAVLMSCCSLNHAQRAATTILEAIREFQFRWEGHAFRVGVSIGMVAITEDTSSTLSNVLKQADTACYMAKEAGRNRIHIYQPEDLDLAKRQGEMQWVERIHKALEEDLFCIYAQTITSLKGQNGIHHELLIRKKDNKGNLILPGAFLPAAERYNLMTKIDRWMIEHAFKKMATYPTFVNQIDFVSINLSGQSLTDDSFLDFVIAQLQATEIEGKKLCFEITETAAIANLSVATKFINTLKSIGCHFALDDFGSGLSSFGYLTHLCHITSNFCCLSIS